jgi:hypothetical protein
MTFHEFSSVFASVSSTYICRLQMSHLDVSKVYRMLRMLQWLWWLADSGLGRASAATLRDALRPMLFLPFLPFPPSRLDISVGVEVGVVESDALGGATFGAP